EILRSEDYDERSDLFSLAVMAWEVFVGRKPWHHDNLTAALVASSNGFVLPRLPIGTVPQAVAPTLMVVLRAATEMRPEGRTHSVAAFARALRDATRASTFATDVSDIISDTIPPTSSATTGTRILPPAKSWPGASTQKTNP